MKKNRHGPTKKNKALVACMEFFRHEADYTESERLRARLLILLNQVYEALGKPSMADIDRIKGR